MNVRLYDGTARCSEHMDSSSYQGLTADQCLYCPEGAPEEPSEDLGDTTDRKAYNQYISDGLADTDGHFAPLSFEAFMGRAIKMRKDFCHCGKESKWATAQGEVCEDHRVRILRTPNRDYSLIR